MIRKENISLLQACGGTLTKGSEELHKDLLWRVKGCFRCQVRGGTLIGTGILDCNPCVCGNREIVWNRESSMAVQCCLSFSLFLGRSNSGAMHCNAACAWHRVHRKCMLRMQRQQVQPALLHSLYNWRHSSSGPWGQLPCHCSTAQQSNS